jgi:hypothetical protein
MRERGEERCFIYAVADIPFLLLVTQQVKGKRGLHRKSTPFKLSRT